MEKEQNDDKLKPIQQDANEEPEIYAIGKGPEGPSFTRRGFLSMLGAGAGIAAMARKEEGQAPIQKLIAHSMWITSITFSPDGKILASGSWDKTIRLWEVKTGKLTATINSQSGKGIYSLAFSPDGNTLAAGTYDAVELWNLKSKTPKAITGLETDAGLVNSVAFSPDGELLASGSFSKKLHLWDVSAQKKVATFEGFQ
ncbi:MAG: PD40 domain-containing protein, partial [Lewinellaceae bacterium]|nr:PD40 domain-containing protein [Lewinellaceae bacterium]